MTPVPTVAQAQDGGRTGQDGSGLPWATLELLRGLEREVVVDWQLVPSDMERRP
jgi:hypothetical protein